MKRWVVAQKGADFEAIASKYNISKYLARIIRNRNVTDDKAINMFLNGTLCDMHNPALLKDMDRAADIIIGAVRGGDKIRIIGDYDIDGICATYILKTTLSLLGGDVDARLPDRIADGYGLNRSLIDSAHGDGISLIVTCDNGIAAAAEIEYAKSLGMKVVVTDHHEVPFTTENDEKRYIIPAADAVVDPKRKDCDYPFEGICGAMVAYKLSVYITSNSDYKDYTGDFTEEVMDELLVFAAFATIGDVMELLDENRIAVREGLKLIAECSNAGLRALIEVTGLDKSNISVYNIGFVLGPCMNATGRLDTAMRALELLECDDYQKAVMIAQELKELNESRKNMTQLFAEKAIEMADSAEYAEDKVLVIFLPDCHESLAGIVAGRVREKYYKPTIVLTKGSEGVKGSGRSIEEYDMYSELNRVSDLFTKFGGHKMAAGMSLFEDQIEGLRTRLNENTTLTKEQLVEKCVIDIPLPVGSADLDFAREIDELAPFGVGNPKPLFAQKDVPFSNLKVVGANRNVLKITFEGVNSSGESVKREGIMFGDVLPVYEDLMGRDTVSVLYQIDINSFMGRDSVQLIIKDYF